MQYDLNLVGLGLRLQTPAPIRVSEKLQPFVCEKPETPDCTVTVESSPVLPEPSGEGVWHGLDYYDRRGAQMRTFHSATEGSPAFSVTTFLENGDITLSVLPEYMHYYRGSEGIFNKVGLETLLLQHKGLLLHAALIKYNGKALAFTGPSGVGKSTHAALWETHLGATIINGDRAALRQLDTGWMAYGSPYAGTSGIYRQDRGELAAIVVLRQGAENRLEKLSLSQALPYIYPELAIHYWDKIFTGKAMDLCLALLAQTPVYLLECLPDLSAAELVRKGLNL